MLEVRAGRLLYNRSFSTRLVSARKISHLASNMPGNVFGSCVATHWTCPSVTLASRFSRYPSDPARFRTRNETPAGICSLGLRGPSLPPSEHGFGEVYAAITAAGEMALNAADFAVQNQALSVRHGCIRTVGSRARVYAGWGTISAR